MPPTGYDPAAARDRREVRPWTRSLAGHRFLGTAEVVGRVDGDPVVIDADHAHGDAVLEEAEHLHALGSLDGPRSEVGEGTESVLREGVQAELPEIARPRALRVRNGWRDRASA